MQIRILGRKRFTYSNKRLREEAKRLGYRLTVVDPADYEIAIGRQSPLLFKGGRTEENIDVVLPRMGASITNYALAVMTQFEMMGIPVINSSTATHRTRDKLRCFQLLSQSDIDIPRTVVIRRPSDLPISIKRVGGFPVVLKLLSGSQGVGVMLAENMNVIESTLDTLWSLGQDILLQECVKESLGRDVRVVIVGGKVVGAIRRQARLGEFRANVHRGAIASSVDLPAEYTKTAVEAAEQVGLDIAGVDLLESHLGPKVIEVNSAPGLEGFEQATGANVAGLILEYAAGRVAERQPSKSA